MVCPCVASLKMENYKPFNKAKLQENFKAFLQPLTLDPSFCHLEFVFRGRIPCHCRVWWRFPAEAAAFCLLLLSGLLSWALDFSWLCWELSCWHCPCSLPLPLLLSLPHSLSVFRSPAPLALPFWIPAPVYDSIYVDVSKKTMDFVWI